MALTNRRRFPVLLILIAVLALFLASAPARAQEGSAPDAPTGLTVASVSHDSVELDWDDSGDSSITHYQVFRRDRAVHDAGEFVIIEEDTGSTATEYTDATVEADEEYVYRVKAVNAYGASPWSDHVRADTPTGPGQGAVYTYEDGDRTIRVILQGDLVVQETGADTPSDGAVRRTAGGNIVRKQSGQGGADLPVFRSASGGALMTLPGGVLLALDPEWDRAAVNGFFARNNISKGRISDLDYIPNGFFVRTEPGFPSLELANALAAQKGVLLSSPNWWREVRQDPEETKGDDREGTQEAQGIQPRNEGIGEAYDLPLDGSYTEPTYIYPADDIDYFKLDLLGQAGDTDVRIYTTGEFDTIGELYDSELNFLTIDGDSFGTDNFSLLASLSPDIYYVLVRGSGFDTGSYTLHSETVTATSSVSLGSSVAASIGAAGEVDYFKLDLSGQIGNTDVSLFTLSDNLALEMEATPFESWLRRWNQDALGDVRWITYLGYGSLSPGSYLFAVWSPSGDTGDYSLRAATVPDHGSTTAAATDLSLDAPTSGKLTSASDADYFKLVLTEAKDLAIMALAYDGVDVVMLNSGGTEIPVNEEIAPRDHKIIDGFAPGTYYVKITAPDASSSSPVHYALYAYEDTGYGEWSGDCADDTNDLGSSTINDPLYACQWHLNSGDSAGMDINVESVWADRITGAGVNVAVVDYTIDHSHDDLSANINSALNHDYGARSNAYRPADHHGTNVAGVIAARDNTIGVRGVAPRATIYGHNLLADGEIYVTDVNKADAMARNRVATAVSNNSWGPVDGFGFDHAPAVWEIAIDTGVTLGDDGKGVFYAWAGGNGGRPGVGFMRGDNSNFDEYANYYGVTAVCAVGDDGIRSSYSEQGANLWVCAPSSGGDRGIVTTENSDRYINDFSGTSSATPKVAGVAALLRQANPDLTWRDLKLILAASAGQNDAGNPGWEQGARKYGSTDDSDRYYFNHEYGFGVVDAAAAVALARDWNTLPEFQDASSASGTLNSIIPDYSASGVRHAVSVSSDIEFTEFVEVNVTIDHTFWRDLRIELVSPAGTVSTLAVPVVFIGTPVRPPDSTVSPATFRFGSAKHLGEDPNGRWTLRVADGLAADQGTLLSWSITVYGHGGNSVSAVSTGRTTATATVVLNNPDSESLTVHLRYSGGAGTTWSAPRTQTTTGTSADFSLTGLAPNREYVLEASLDSTFSDGNEVTANFVNRPANQDIDTLAAAGNTFPVSLWSNGTTIWVVNEGTGHGNKIYAYTLATGARDSDKDIDTLYAAGNTSPVGLWSDGTNIWVANNGYGADDKLYAYTLASGARDEDKDFDTLAAAGNINPYDLWSDGATMWVADNGDAPSGPKLYAYTLATGARDEDKDFDTLAAAGNYRPRGLWSGGTTMWVADSEDDKIYAYTLVTGARDEDKDFDTLAAAGNTVPLGLWSDDTTIWVADIAAEKLYAYYIEVSTRTPVTGPPDLVVESTSVINSNPAAGASFTLSATVRNQGNGAMRPGVFLRYYSSTDDTITTGDNQVGRSPVRALNAGDTSEEAIRLFAPASAGTYYYGACVDAVTNESDTTNNCSAAVEVTVTAAPPQPNTSLSPSASDPYAPAATVVYTVTFEGQWDAAATPGGVPGGAHFSRLIGALHNSGVTFLRSGETASDGVESMAEEGGWMSLRDEVENAGTNALDVLRGDTDNIGPTTSKTHTLTVTAEHPRVTLLTMIAPSPDWFVGVSGLTLLDDQGDWVESLQVDLYPWDAGTEDGGEFSLSNSATSPQGVITNLRGTGKFSNARIATLTFTRQSVNPGPTGTPTFIGEQRVGEVLRVDTSSIDDPNGFTNRDFSFTWLADDDLMELGFYLRALSCCDGYEIAPYDAGMTIKVQIHFDDDLGNHEVIVLPAPSTVAAAAPDQPRNLSASLGGPGELNLSWSTPAVCDFTLDFSCWRILDRMYNVGDGGSDITGYTVQWKLSSGDWGRASDVSEAEITETSYTITGLVSSNTYAVRVRARNVAGLGTPSTEVTVSGASLNVGPVVSGRANPYFFEGNPRDVTTYIATDPESDGITWSLSGDDASFFSIADGALNFDSAGDFEDPQDVGGNNAYDLNILASDGQNTATFPVTVIIRDVEDERPVITGDNALTFAEGTDTTTVLQTYSATDPEGVNTSFAWSLHGTDSGDFDISDAGALTFKNVPDFDSPADGDGDNVYNVQVRAEDATKTAGLDVTVTVTNVNEPPTVNGNPQLDVFENDEGFSESYSAIDPEGLNITRWSTSGRDGGDFVINEQGDLRFRNIPDFERPADSNRDNVYEVTVRAYDGRYYGSFDVTVTVNDVNEPPTITTTSSSATALRQNENVTSRLYTYRATDPEGADTVTWSVEGVDKEFFDIDERGQFSFKEENPPDFEQPADSGRDNVYNVVVQAADDGRNVDTLDVTVTVREVNEGPEVTSGSPSFTIDENQDLPSAVYTGFDPEGGTVTRWTVGGTDRGDFTITQEGVLTFRNIPDFERPADSDRNNVYVFTVRPYDGRYYGSFDVTVTVNDVNEPPTITTTSSSATALRQNENVTSRLYTYRATDPEGADTVTWSVGGVDAGFFTITERGEFSFKAENPPDYEDPADSDRNNVYNVVVQASDDSITPNTAMLPVTITVRDVNEGPEVTSGSPSFTISENQDLPNAVYEGFDPEGGTVTRWTVGGTDGGDFTISQEGVLTFRNIPDFERPVDSNRDNIYELQVRPYDGRYYGSFDVTVTVNDVNEPPTITTTSGSGTALRQNENVTSRLYTYRATDPEGADTVIWSVGGVDARFFTIDESGGQFSSKEENAPDYERPADSGGDNVYNVVVQATDDGGNVDTLDVTVTVANDAEGVEPTITTRRPPTTYRENDTRTVYTFRASDPQRGPIRWSLEGTDREDFNIAADGSGRGMLAFISPPDYEKPADSDQQNDYELTVIATDEDDNVDRLSYTITVTEVDEGPEVSGPSSFSIAENRSLSNAVYTATDPEGSNVARWSVGGRDGGDFFITQGGTLYFRSPPDYERPADSDRDNVYEVTIQPSDGRNNGSYPVTVTVGNVNEPPEIRSGSKTSFMQPENRTSRLHTYSAADPEGGTVTWAVVGPDAGLFTIDERGQFSFREEDPPDFDNPGDVGEDNVYDVTIQARDPESKTASLPVTVTVTEVNERPVITRDGNLFGSPPGRVPENQSVTQVLATYTASDPERPGVKITRWSTTGRDGGDFVINALGQLMFRNAPDYERPADSDRDNVYEVTIRASDGRNTGTLDVTVTVTDVNEAPTITTTSRTAFTQPEDRTSTLYTFRATDPEGGDVSWGLSGTDSSAFTMSETGALSFTNPPDYEQPADSGRDNMYEVTIRASDGRNTGTLDVTVTVTDHNEGQEPTISTRRPPSTYRENGTSAVYTFRASDPQRGATITWKLEGTDREDFTLAPDSSGRAVLAFRNSPDFESPADADRDNVYELAVVATDDEGNSDRVDFAIAVTDHNEGVEPTISTRRPPTTYRENDTRTVYTFRASDPQRGTTITWTLEGTDAADFTITPDSSGRGVLAFISPPDFESPADADRDNTYELAVVATDDDGNSDLVDFTIAVTDVNEGPVIRLEGAATTSVPENTPDTKVLADFTATDPEDPTANIFRWSTAGRDGGDFVISDLGELRFRSSPDYERPADSNRDNVYEVTVRAYDGRVYGTHDVTVTVAQVNEAPVITTKSRTEFTLRENFTAVLYTYRATDQDEDDAVTWSVEGDDGGDFAIYDGILNFRLLPDLENPADEDEDNVYEIIVVAADRAGLRDTVDAVITITDQSEGPVIAGTRAYTVAENYDIARVLGSYTATDAKDNRPVFPRWSLSGRDGGDFTINEDGELAFRNIPDYDRPADSNRDNVYEVTVRGHDSQAYGNLEVTVTVTPVNEHDPVVTGRETLSFRENTAVETRLHTYRATDGDRDTSFTWSLEGDDADDFLIDEGVLTFSAPPDYEQPADRDADNVYRVTVMASDGANRGTLDVTVTVTEQNEGPVVSGAPEFTINENRHLPSSAVYTARDPEAVGGVTTTIRWSVSGRDGGDFTIDRDTGVLAFRTPPDHERPADANRDNVYEVTVRAHDGRNYGDFQVTVTVEDVAEITGPAAISRTENFEGGLATYSPAGQGDLNVDPSWRLTGADSGDFTIDRETGELTFRSIPDHERPADSNRDNVYSFTVSVSDGSYHGTLDVTVTVDAVNEPPAVTGRDSLSFRENTPVTTRLHTYRATDPEGDGFTWHLGGLDAEDFTITTDSSGRGVLTFASPPNFDIPSGSGAHVNEYLVTVVASDGTNRGTLDVTVTVTDQNEGAVVTGDQTIAVRENQDPAVTLATYSATDPEGQRITRWSLSGSDGGDFLISANGDLAFRNTPDYDRPADSNRDNEYRVTVRAYDGRTYGNLDVTVTVSNVNEHPPVIRSGSRTSFAYREEGTSVLYTYRATDGDKDDTITWTTEGTDGGDFTIDGDTGELTFREPPDYEAPGDSGRDNQYNLTVLATDSGRQRASLDITVTVTAVDEGPEVSGTTAYTVSEGQDLAEATFTAQDPEDAGAAVTSWRLAGSDAGDFTITDTGHNSAQLTFRNTPDYDRPADSNRDNEYLVTIRAYNGSTYGSLDVTVTVTDRNEAAPVVTGRDTLSFRENTATTTRLHTYRATDTDRDTEITWSVEGDDGNDFTISTGGELFFSNIPDHEQAADSGSDNVYEITVVASDGSKEGTLAVTVTVTDVNEGPEITGTQSLSFDENTATDRVLATYTATDPEDPDLEITRWSVTGRDGGDFFISEDGELTFRNPPDHERPADSGRDNVYEVTVRASDGRVYGTHDVTVTVTPVDEAPEFRSGSRDSFSYRENGTAALYTYRATDPEGAEVAWSVSGADGGDFTIDRDTGVLTFLNLPDYDDPADDGRDNEYLVTVVATDQTGHPASLPVTVTVTDVNEGPVIADTGTNTAITVEENYDGVLATYTATDPEDPTAEITRWSVTGRDGGDFTISDGGELTFRNPPDHERPADSNRDSVYEATVRASDGRYYGTLNVTVTVLAVDEAPEFQRNTQDSFVYPENGTSAIYTYRATDPEGSAVAWDLSGTDSSAFSIDKTGVLTFNSPPDYEDPADTDDDNVYEVVVQATDGTGKTARLVVTVTVTNLTDARAVIRGTAQVGRTLTAETSGIPDEDRRNKVDFSYQWLADETDVEGGTDSTYELTEKDEGKTIKVRVTFTDNAGKEETLTSATTAPVKPAQSNEPAAGLPTINGTAQVGETLTADTSGISDADGMTNAVFRYQWTRRDGDTDEDIEGATDSTYEVSDGDEGKTIRVRVGFSDDRGSDEALTSAATGAVAARPAQLTATFPASPFQSSRHKGDDDRPQVIVAFNLPVQSFDKTTPSVSLTGATVSSLVRHEEDGLENAWVFFLDPEGNDDVVFTLFAGQSCDVGGICTGEGKMLSEGGTTTLPGPDEEDKPDNTDSNEPDSPATGAPTIGGTAQVGETLTANTSGIADADGLANATFGYQWLADDTDIAGATGLTYTLTDSEESKAITVQVSFTDDAGNEETQTSGATAAVAGAQPTEPPDKPRGLEATTATHDSVTLTWDDPGDDTITGYVILRRIPGDDPEGHFDVLVADTGTAATTYTDNTVSAETRYTYRIKAINGAGTSERSRWSHIDVPAAPVPDKPTGLEATVSHGQVVLTWDDPGDDTITGYVILRRVRENNTGGDFSVLVADTGTAATTYTDDTVAAGTTYTYRIKAINEHGTSERSRWFHIYIPAAP